MRVAVGECQRLGGVYIKFLQMLAVHLTTKELVNDISNRLVFEQVTYEPIDVVYEVKTSLGSDMLTRFQEIPQEPFAAGSYGQVYLARLTSGEQVIIKVSRPSVRKNLQTDLFLLRIAATVINWFTAGSIIHTKRLFNEFARATRLETDYRHEADAAEWMREYFASEPKFYIPKTYSELSGGSVLVQEYVGGVSLASAMDAQKAGSDIVALYDIPV